MLRDCKVRLCPLEMVRFGQVTCGGSQVQSIVPLLEYTVGYIVGWTKSVMFWLAGLMLVRIAVNCKGSPCATESDVKNAENDQMVFPTDEACIPPPTV